MVPSYHHLSRIIENQSQTSTNRTNTNDINPIGDTVDLPRRRTNRCNIRSSRWLINNRTPLNEHIIEIMNRCCASSSSTRNSRSRAHEIRIPDVIVQALASWTWWQDNPGNHCASSTCWCSNVVCKYGVESNTARSQPRTARSLPRTARSLPCGS